MVGRVTSGRWPVRATWRHTPVSVSRTTMPLGSSGLSAKENVSVEPAYQMPLATSVWKW